MNINWTLWIPIIAALIIQVFGVLLQEILVRAREKPKTKALVQNNTQTGVAKRLLYFLFPPDIRLLFMLISLIASIFLWEQVESPQPLTRWDVFKIVGLFSILLINLFMDMLIGTYKVFAASDVFKQLVADKAKSLESKTPANNALQPTADSMPLKEHLPSKSEASRGGG